MFATTAHPSGDINIFHHIMILAVVEIYLTSLVGVSCEPPVKSVAELFKQLNSHHDFQQFISSLRSAFKNLANKEN